MFDCFVRRNRRSWRFSDGVAQRAEPQVAAVFASRARNTDMPMATTIEINRLRQPHLARRMGGGYGV
jgi:hypothetical protein